MQRYWDRQTHTQDTGTHKYTHIDEHTLRAKNKHIPQQRQTYAQIHRLRHPETYRDRDACSC